MSGRNTTLGRVGEEEEDGTLTVEEGAGDRATIGGEELSMVRTPSHSRLLH